ncbi:plastocyanin/azurin family copper-binding protein [Saccharicrinis sp. GN24d3]|uniref:plastocyanin/azurin family copper-binding protein n=1 Tax=Saccharicrinis sp. GN24d3 TaxID=3458416 RepID=UPI0040360CD3
MKQLYCFKNFRMVLLAFSFLSPLLMQAETHEVIVSNGNFTPKDVIIKAGDVVKWMQIEGSHNVNGTQDTYPDNAESFGNGEAASGDWNYSYQFTTPGAFDYQCDPHVAFGMVGTITVVETSSTFHEVIVSNGNFTPKDVIIKAGDVVKWMQIEGSHNVNGTQDTYPDNAESFGNGEAASGDWNYSYQFTTPGAFDYQCDPHVAFGMVGTITVVETSSTFHEVVVSNGNFTPKDVIIKAGDVVKWMQIEGSHNVNGTQDTYPDNAESFGNGEAASGDWNYAYQFTTPGAFDYQCDPHVAFGMVGTITVVETSSTFHEVVVSNGNFTPKDVIIKAGDVVKWMQIEGSHNVNGSQDTYPDNPESFGNGEAASGDWTYAYQFTTPGTYDYQCDPHVDFGMVGTVTVTTVTSIEGQLAKKAKLLCYPNPTENTLFFKIEEDFGKEITINIYNSAGSLVKSKNAEVSETNKIETSELIGGYYQLQIVTDSQRYQFKFIKK